MILRPPSLETDFNLGLDLSAFFRSPVHTFRNPWNNRRPKGSPRGGIHFRQVSIQ